MTLPHALPHLGDVAADYDILLCDVWGVIHNGRESWTAPCEALTRFSRAGGHVVLISNSPRPASDVIAQLDSLGVPREAWKAFVTSGDATRAELAKRAPGPAWIVGPERDAPLYAGLGLERAIGAEDAAFISVTGPVDDTVETPEELSRAVRRRGRPRHRTDLRQPGQGGATRRPAESIAAGALADLYASQGGRVVMAGKPFRAHLRPGDAGGRGPVGPPRRPLAGCCASATGW